MKLLLDTHVWFWALTAPERLSQRAQSAVEDPDNELWLSAISMWELHLLATRGRVSLDAPPAEWMERELVRFPVRDAPVTRAIAVRSREVTLPHDDPADRFIVATAILEGHRLVTADGRLLSSRLCATLNARR